MGWKVSRRNFLYAMAILSSAFTAGLGSIGAILKGTSGRRDPIRRENRYISDGKSLVAVVGGRDVKAMVAESVSLIGGFEKIGVSGKKVLVKPNVVNASKSPTTTNPAVVRAVVELLFEAGAAEVRVGDMSALARLSTKRNMERTGIKRAAEEAGAKTVYFEDHEWYEVPLPGGKYVKEVGVSEWIFTSDLIVNLPVIKTHRSASYTICLKNFVGATHFKWRPYLVDSDHWEEVVAEINLAYTPDLNIADGTTTMVEGGPWSGKEARTNLVMAGGDRVAADVVGLGIIKSFGIWPDVTRKGVWQQRQIKRAVELGMGARNAGEVELLTASLDGDPEFARLMEKIREYMA
jgi:uncharacterized protein (DUF362 family)